MPEAALAEAVSELARTIAANAPLSIRASKVTIANILKDPADRDMMLIERLGSVCMDSEDFREGRQAFMQKRAPSFAGR